MTQKTQKKERPLTMKQKAFAREIVKTNNGTQTALKIYDTDNYKTASAIASENLAKPRIKEEVERLCALQGLTTNLVIQTHKRNIEQSDNISASQQAINTYYDIIGLSSQDKTNQTQIAIIIEK